MDAALSLVAIGWVVWGGGIALLATGHPIISIACSAAACVFWATSLVCALRDS